MTVTPPLAYCEHGYCETEHCRTCEIMGVCLRCGVANPAPVERETCVVTGVREAADTAETLRVVAKMLDGLADALESDDEIMGSICGTGLAYNLPALPKHVRDVIAEYVSDEAARSYRADAAYMEASS